MSYRDKIRKAIECPQFGDYSYGEWGALRYEQKVLIKRLLDELDRADELIKKMYFQKQEIIDCLKDLVKNRHTNSKVVWFDSEYAKTYGELCSMAGAGDTRLALLPLSEIEEILSKIEKE